MPHALACATMSGNSVMTSMRMSESVDSCQSRPRFPWRGACRDTRRRLRISFVGCPVDVDPSRGLVDAIDVCVDPRNEPLLAIVGDDARDRMRGARDEFTEHSERNAFTIDDRHRSEER